VRFPQQEYQESSEGHQPENPIFGRYAEESVVSVAEVLLFSRRRQIVN
jgi:hypothetical protein